MPGSVPLGSSELTSEKWQGHCTAHIPNGIHLHSKIPKFPLVKVVYCFDASSMVICQKPAFRSRQEKHPSPTKLSMASYIWGSR